MKIISILFLLGLASNLFSQTWTSQPNPIPFRRTMYSCCAVDSNICWMCGDTALVMRTTNGGTNWNIVSQGLSNINFYYIFSTDANHAWVGGDDSLIYYTTNGGINWHISVPTPATSFIDGIHMFNNSIGFAISDPPYGVLIWDYYITTNGGVNWTRGENAPPCSSGETGFNSCIWALDTGHIYWGGTASKIYSGGFKGSITSISVPLGNVFGVSFENTSTGLIISSAVTYRTTNGGTNWTLVSGSTGGYGISTAPSIGSYFFWICKGNGVPGGIYRSTNDGSSFNAQLTGHHVFSISMFNVQIGWAGSDSSRIFKYTSSDPVGIKKINTGLPDSYSLSQNYPNPFNPTTTIRFSVPLTNLVNIVVYDILGNKVATLLDKRMLAGSYEVEFNASNLSSGVYFYTITAGQFKDSKKMILAK